MWAALPDLVREARFWSPACHSFPLWAGILLGFLCCSIGCACGILLTAFVLSAAVRRAIAALLRVIIGWLDLAQGAPDLRRHFRNRFLEYRARE